MKKKREVKKILLVFTVLSGLLFPLACSDNNNAPKNPAGPIVGAATMTPTGTLTPTTPTNTFTTVPGANTPTFTPTFSLPAPVFRANSSTSASPRCMVLNGGVLTVAENQVTVGGSLSFMEEYTGAGTAALNLYNCCPVGGGPYPNVSNIILTGAPPIATPGTPVAFVPVTVALQSVQGFVNPGGNIPGAWSAVLDLSAGGGATLYTGYYSSWNAQGLGPLYVPFFGNGYQGIPFNNPRGICDDGTGGSGHVYVADTGLGYVDELSPYEGTPGQIPIPIARWNGFPGVTVGGTGVIFNSAAVTFKSPYAVACDAAGNVWVGDDGYNPSYISEYISGATTILESWPAIPNSVVHGLAVDNGTGNVYVADAGNNLVEVYSPTGTLLTAFGDPSPGPYEPYPFQPSCIAFSGGFIYVGDIGNNYIDVFQ